MATARSKAPQIGSAQWIQRERDQVDDLVVKEVEEFGYSARNELDWLNEHMADVFSNGTVNFTDVFKTPGKLRGKTPRTARKRETLAPRQPLTDIFAPSVQPTASPLKSTAVFDHAVQFKIAEDTEDVPSENRPKSRSKSPQRLGKPGNIDSGYHGLTEDEMDVDARNSDIALSVQQNETHDVQMAAEQIKLTRTNAGVEDAGPSSDESFASAKESLSMRNAALSKIVPEEHSDDATVADEATIADETSIAVEATIADDAPFQPGQVNAAETVVPGPQLSDEDLVDSSHTDTTSPDQPLQRKSSFNFSALPAREPLTSKRSFGARNSHIDAPGRNSVAAKAVGKAPAVDAANDAVAPVEKPEEVRAHSKTSTQLLHERIHLLGKAKEQRNSKSVAQSIQYPQLPAEDIDQAILSENAQDVLKSSADDGDEDWIAPTKSQQHEALSKNVEGQKQIIASPARPNIHQKSISATNIPSPSRANTNVESRLQKAMSVSSVNLANARQPATPVGSPAMKKHHEGPLSASKNRLWSALKSAKNIFASSASASAAAKLEVHDNSPILRSPKRNISDESKTAAVIRMPGALYSETQLVRSPSRPISIVSLSPSRKTRSSSESDRRREKELKAQQKANEELDKAREKERQKAAKEQEERQRAEEAEVERRGKESMRAGKSGRPGTAETDSAREDMSRSALTKGALSAAGKLRSVGKPLRPGKDASKAKPAPVNIRLASQMQRLAQGPSQSSSQMDNGATSSRPPTSMRPASSQGNARSSTMPSTNGRVKALEAAARKKELEEKEKQRKAEQKKELERKRAAKAEDEKRAEAERKAAEEQRRAQEAKFAAQKQAEKQAAEAKRREHQRLEQQRHEQQRQEEQRREQQRLEQQRQQEAAHKAKAAHELAEAIQRDRTQQQTTSRGDVPGTLRQLVQKTFTEQGARPPHQPNPAKPPKRVFNADGEESSNPTQRPGVQRGPPSYQRNDAKRRKTDEEQEEDQRHSVMAPPKRPSTMRKETLTRFPHGYAHAPPPAAHHSTNMFKPAVTSQHPLQQGQRAAPTHPSQTVQVSNARIPFAENNNPPAISHYVPSGHPGHENAPPGAPYNKFKTPVRPAQAPKSAKSSPMYPNGDAIALPEIATDSEEEDDEDEDEGTGFRAPSWVASPALRELLTQQQLVDPEAVFGPIGELRMEEVFKGSKNPERLKKFRDRGSSAAWVQNGDAVTSAEKRRDMELRERVVKEGGWRYEPGL